MIGKLEAALEGALGNAAIEEFALLGLLVFGLFTLDGQHMGMCLDRKLGFIEAGNGHGYPVKVLAGAFNIVGRIALGLFRLTEAVQHGEQAIETDGGTVERGKIDVTHGVLLEATLAFSLDRWHPAWGDAGGGSRTLLASAGTMWEMPRLNSRSSVPRGIFPG